MEQLAATAKPAGNLAVGRDARERRLPSKKARVGARERSKKPTRGRARARHQILVVDDHPIVRQGLRRLIDQERDLAVCGEAESLLEAEAALRDLKPDIVIIDISLKQGDGIELVKGARAKHPQLPILVLSMHDEVIYAERVLAAGANGYIMKQAESEELLLAMRRVLGGGIYVSEAIGKTTTTWMLGHLLVESGVAEHFFNSGGSLASRNLVKRGKEIKVLPRREPREK